MAKLFLALPTNAADGPGASVDVTTLGATKTIVVEGNGSGLYEPYVLIEFSNDNAGLIWSPLTQFLRPGSKDVVIACRFMRANVKNYKQGGAPTVNVGAEDSGASFAELIAPAGNGNGAGVDVSALPAFKTIQVSGAYKGSCNIEVSTDGGVTYSQVTSFRSRQGSGFQSFTLFAEFMRVSRSGIQAREPNPGLPIVDIGAATVAGAGGGGGVSLEQDGTAIGGPFNTIDFLSLGLLITDDGGDHATITPHTEHLTGEGGAPVVIEPLCQTSFLSNTAAETVQVFTLADGEEDGQIHHFVNETEGAITRVVQVVAASSADSDDTWTSSQSHASFTLIWNADLGGWQQLGVDRNFGLEISLQSFSYTVTGVEPDLLNLVIALPDARPDASYLVFTAQQQATNQLGMNVQTASKAVGQFVLTLSAAATAGDIFVFTVLDPS